MYYKFIIALSIYRVFLFETQYENFSRIKVYLGYNGYFLVMWEIYKSVSANPGEFFIKFVNTYLRQKINKNMQTYLELRHV